MTVQATHGSQRIEAFSDAVFAISATLLVVSLEVPRGFDELKRSLAGFIAFAASFAIFVNVWYHHHRFFRAFPIADPITVAINALLLFVVLFFVYPLKFVMLGFTKWITGIGEMTRLTPGELDLLFIIYGLGWAAVYGCFTLLYSHANRRADLLGLTPEQRADARIEAELALAFAAVGLASALVAAFGFSRFWGLPGWMYGLLGVIGAWFGRRWPARRAALMARDAG